MNGGPHLRLELRPSPSLAALILAAHAAAAACAALALPGVAGLLLAALLLALGVASAWSRALLRAKGSIRAIDIGSGALLLETTGGRSLVAGPGARRYVSRWVVMLPLGRPVRRTLLVTSGMLEPAVFRRFRLWALWGKVPPVAGVQLST